ncbi:MAG: DUF4203 domain-containing protein [Eubacterium sp.]|nr:DUF4203 domain-containing protein [Eubacterium sp.]
MSLPFLEFFKLPELSEQAAAVFAAVKIAAAFLACFCGYRFAKGFAALTGFFLGASLAWSFTARLEAMPALWRAVIVLAAGFLVSVLAFRLYRFGIWIYIGGLLAASMASAAMPEGKIWDMIRIVLVIAVFFAGGYLASRLFKPFIIIASSVGGAHAALLPLTVVWKQLDGDPRMQLIVFSGLAGIGMLTQFLTTRGR